MARVIPKSTDVVRAVGWVTFLELIRDKILYNIVVVSLLLLGFGFLASRLSFIRPDRVVIDFGLSALNISCSLVAILAGAGLLTREFERRTILVALSRPISKPQFILGKFSGLSLLLALNWLLLVGAFFIILSVSGEGVGPNFSFALVWALVSVLLQSVLLAALAILFSTFSTTSLSVMMSLGMYVIGANISQIRMVVAKLGNPLSKFVLNSFATALPNLEHFMLGTTVTYGLPVVPAFVWTAIGYSFLYTSLLLTVAGILIQRKEH